VKSPAALKRDARSEPAHYTSGSTRASRFNAAGDFRALSFSFTVTQQKERPLVLIVNAQHAKEAEDDKPAEKPLKLVTCVCFLIEKSLFQAFQ